MRDLHDQVNRRVDELLARWSKAGSPNTDSHARERWQQACQDHFNNAAELARIVATKLEKSDSSRSLSCTIPKP